MKKYNVEIENGTLRQLCITNDWFTAGTNEQYAKLFELNEKGASIDTLATVIWTCSTGEEYDTILTKLEEASAWPLYVDYIVEKLEYMQFGKTELEIIRQALTTHPDAGKSYRVVSF